MGASRSDKVLLWEVPLPHLAAFSLPKFLRALKQHPEHGHKIAKRVNSGFPQPPCLCSRDSERPRGSPFLLPMPFLPQNGGGGPVWVPITQETSRKPLRGHRRPGASPPQSRVQRPTIRTNPSPFFCFGSGFFSLPGAWVWETGNNFLLKAIFVG